MRLSLKNIGKIKEASVEINGITVIAGENDTGKSTVGRALFSVFNSFCDIDVRIREERVESIVTILKSLFRSRPFRMAITFDWEEAALDMIGQAELLKEDASLIRKKLTGFTEQLGEDVQKYIEYEELDQNAMRIKELLHVSDDEIFKSILARRLDKEFNGQICNIFSDLSDVAGEIGLQIKDEDMLLTIDANNVIDRKGSIHLHTEAVYLDDPFILDEPQNIFLPYRANSVDHRTDLKLKLACGKEETNVIEKIVINNKFENIYSKIEAVCSGELVRDKRYGYDYRGKDNGKALNVRNLSTGLKTFAILKVLLQNGVIEYNGTIILDEPEIHLHPEWQLLFAELIVLMQKEFSMHILLNTHSPYFLRAIQVYSARYEIADRCNYYLSEATETGEYAYITDVTDDIERIYRKLSRPLQQLEDERWQND